MTGTTMVGTILRAAASSKSSARAAWVLSTAPRTLPWAAKWRSRSCQKLQCRGIDTYSRHRSGVVSQRNSSLARPEVEMKRALYLLPLVAIALLSLAVAVQNPAALTDSLIQPFSSREEVEQFLLTA